MPKLESSPGETLVLTLVRGDNTVITVTIDAGSVEWSADDGGERGDKMRDGATSGPTDLCTIGDVIARIDILRATSWIAVCEFAEGHADEDVWESESGTEQFANDEAEAHRRDATRDECKVEVHTRQIG